MTYREDLLQDVINYFKDTTQTKLYLDRWPVSTLTLNYC